MKWNWGTGIVVGMSCFIGFILYFVITMITDQRYSHDLVTEEYYEKEMYYQNEIDAETNTNNLSEKLVSKRTVDGWVITFPSQIKVENIEGKLFLYRPSNQKLDFETQLSLSDHNLLIPDNKLIDGRWNITIDWTYDGQSYMYKEEILY